MSDGWRRGGYHFRLLAFGMINMRILMMLNIGLHDEGEPKHYLELPLLVPL
jgi:hypothetical protein